MSHNLVKDFLEFSFVPLMKKTLKYIIFTSILALLNSVQLFANSNFIGANQEKIVEHYTLNSSDFNINIFNYTIKNALKQVYKKRAINIDNEEEEVDGISAKKNIEKYKLTSFIFNSLSIISFSEFNKSLPLWNDIMPFFHYDSLYLLFGVLRI